MKERTKQLKFVNQELIQEIFERKRIQSQLLEMALHDGLTGLPNRALFMEQLEQELKCVSANSAYQFAVLFLDCDRFKIINDSLGHLIGDELLIAIAHRLKDCLRSADTIARLGGTNLLYFCLMFRLLTARLRLLIDCSSLCPNRFNSQDGRCLWEQVLVLFWVMRAIHSLNICYETQTR